MLIPVLSEMDTGIKTDKNSGGGMKVRGSLIQGTDGAYAFSEALPLICDRPWETRDKVSI